MTKPLGSAPSADAIMASSVQDASDLAVLLPQKTVQVATTKGALQASNGAVGRIRVGTTPFDFLDLVYDSTYGHWVSAEILVMSVYAVSTTNTSNIAWGSLTGAGPAPDRMLKLKDFANAGLTLQARMSAALNNSTGGDGCTIDLFTQTIDLGGDFNSSTVQGGVFNMTVTGVTRAMKDSGWATVTVDAATHDYVLIEPVVKAVTGGTANVLIGTCCARWIG